MSHEDPTVGGAITAAWGTARERRGTYEPALTVTGTAPVIGSDGFLTGKWWASGGLVSVSIDLFITEQTGDPEGEISGTSWRISLPFDAAADFHVPGVLNEASDAIGGVFTRSNASADSMHGVTLLAPQSRMIFYRHGSATSIGSPAFPGSIARLKAFASYVADHDAMEAALA